MSAAPGAVVVEEPAPVGDPSASDLAQATSRLMSTYASGDAPPPPPLREARDAFERAYLDAVLARSNGNVTAAAKLAGRNRTDFYDLMRRHGCSPQDHKRD